MAKKIAIIGGGPGGYVAAIRAAQLGCEVHLIEKEKLGGTCLNVGCIPTKSLLHSAEVYNMVKDGSSLGITSDNVKVDWDKVISKKNHVVDKLVNGVGGLLKANGVNVYEDNAILKNKNTVVLNKLKKEIEVDNIIIATGSSPSKIPFKGHDLNNVIDSTKALSISKIPKSMLIVGGGIIGVEFAALFASFGVKVTIVELLKDIAVMLDKDIRNKLKNNLISKGVDIYTEASIKEVSENKNSLQSVISKDGKDINIESEYVLVAAGRVPNIKDIGLEDLGVETYKNAISVNDMFETNIKGVFAIGDCNAKKMLAHAASAQGVYVVENIMSLSAHYFENTIASCVYVEPEIASVGITEDYAIANGIDIKIGMFNMMGNGKAIIENDGDGFIKIIAGAKYEEVLGVHIYAPRATDLISFASLAIRLESTIDELTSTIFSHPTLSEGILEASLSVNNIAIHSVNKKK